MSISESLRDESKRIPSEAIERLRGRLKAAATSQDSRSTRRPARSGTP